MKRLILIFSIIISLSLSAQTNPGFETGDLTGWTKVNGLAGGTETCVSSNVRTGSNAMAITTTSNSTPTRMENSTTVTTNTNSYFHVITWIRGSVAQAEAAISIKFGSGSYTSGSYVAPSTTYTQISRSRQNTGSSAEGYVGLSTRSSDGTTSITINWDDAITYVSASSTTDITAPNAPSGVGTSSNEAGTTITVTWTDGTDVSTGSQKALILRSNGAGQTPPTLNDQAQYTSGDAVGSWTVKGIVDVGTQTYADNTTSANTAYTYAVFMSDLAYNYSSGTSSSITALPVELTSFTSNVIGNKVELHWRTATEVNNYGFEVQRSVVGGQQSAWTSLGFVRGNGNCNSTKNYSFTDQPASGKEFKYRLKQIDIDGSFEYSFEITAKLENVSAYKLDQNYPNPFNPYTKISYTVPQRAYVHLRVYDMLAKEVVELVNTMQESGRYEVTFDGTNLPSGAYFYKLEAGNYVEVKKLLLVK